MTPTTDSHIKGEVWMPISGWDGRFVQVGSHLNGGQMYSADPILYGSLSVYREMHDVLLRGSATAGTDTGHDTGLHDSSWIVPGNLQEIRDFDFRSIPETTRGAKYVIANFYPSPLGHSYYDGCSTGGGMGMRAAHYFPDDYDGILTGAAIQWAYWSSAIRGLFQNETVLKDSPLIYNSSDGLTFLGGAPGPSYLDAAHSTLVQNAAIAKCDLYDGVADGVITEPFKCDFDPRSIVCTDGQNPNTCITAAQAKTVLAMYKDVVNPRTGEYIYSGLVRSTESAIPAGPAATGTDYGGIIQQLIFDGNLSWNWLTFDYNRDTERVEYQDTTNPGYWLQRVDPDLRTFRGRGRKLIYYQGWVDSGTPPGFFTRYYDEAEKIVGGNAPAALEETQSFFRMFLAPGMGHCRGGVGPNAFGAETHPQIPGIPPYQPEYDALAALEQWVEKGIPPQQIIATKFVNDDPTQGIQTQRPLCPYPEVAGYMGGNTNQAENFMCVPPVEVRIQPETLNLRSKGEFSAFITVPEGYDVRDWEVSNVVCEGAPAVKGIVTDGGRTYTAKFKVSGLEGVTPGKQKFTVKGIFQHNRGTPQFQGRAPVTVTE
jgi:feruloyl esterase